MSNIKKLTFIAISNLLVVYYLINVTHQHHFDTKDMKRKKISVIELTFIT